MVIIEKVSIPLVFLLCVLTFAPYRSSIFVQAELYKPLNAIRCSERDRCPEEWPCCSPYGQCGAGPICLGSCNPRFSFNQSSCAPMPAIVPPAILEYNAIPIEESTPSSTEDRLKDRGLTHFTKYLITADETEADDMLKNIEFTYSGPASIDASSGDILLSMPKRSTGTLLASTRSFLYGDISVRMKTGRSRGVITSVVLISAIGDEIDFEFLGSELKQVQSNYYSRGELVYTNMKELTVSSDTSDNYHVYEIDWDEERVHWMIDETIVRTLYKKDTWDENLKRFRYPQTPMRLELALWPGGAENNHPGTIEWAGGLVDWDNSSDIVTKGQFTAQVEDIFLTPYENRYVPDMSDCLNTENKIAYEYISKPGTTFNETSLGWYCGMVPNLAGWTKSGFSIPRNTIKMKHVSKEMRPISPESHFIQDTGRLSSSADGTLLYNTTRNTTYTLEEESSAYSNFLQKNPIFKLKRLLPRVL